MPVEYRTGDLFAQPDLIAFAHGVNLAGVMGKGIAVEVKRRYPSMFESYRRRCQEGSLDLGDIYEWRVPGGPTVYNLCTQLHWRTGAELKTLVETLHRMVGLAERARIERVHMPRIGAGLGGLSWADVQPEIELVGESTDVRLIVCSLALPTAQKQA